MKRSKSSRILKILSYVLLIGFFNSLSRCHGKTPREPWNFGEKAEKIFKKFNDIRHLLLPYLYSTTYKTHLSDIPVIRPVVMEYPEDRSARNVELEYFLGDSLLVVPVFDQEDEMGLSFYTGFIGPYILEKGYTQSTIGVINSISALSEVPVLFYINRMLRKHGTIKILFLSCFLMGIRILLPIRSGIIGIVLAQLLQGVTYMTMYYSCAVYISTCVYEKYQTKGQSILNVVQLGLGAIVGNLVGGKLIRLLGYEKGYLLMAGITTLMTICALIVYFWKNREQRNGGDVCEI